MIVKISTRMRGKANIENWKSVFTFG